MQAEGIRRAEGGRSEEIEAKLMAWHKDNELSRRLPRRSRAIGPIGAVADWR